MGPMGEIMATQTLTGQYTKGQKQEQKLLLVPFSSFPVSGTRPPAFNQEAALAPGRPAALGQPPGASSAQSQGPAGGYLFVLPVAALDDGSSHFLLFSQGSALWGRGEGGEEKIKRDSV